ncbi:hypothetical protein KI387_033265, partial [Taxus chinensis]
EVPSYRMDDFMLSEDSTDDEGTQNDESGVFTSNLISNFVISICDGKEICEEGEMIEESNSLHDSIMDEHMEEAYFIIKTKE